MKNQISNIPRNARFWTLENGSWVKLTVKPGQVLRWSRFTRDGEGYEVRADVYTRDGEGVRNEWLRRWRDCDGRGEETGAVFAAAGRLSEVAIDDGDTVVLRPCWTQAIETRCRDEFAEAAGY